MNRYFRKTPYHKLHPPFGPIFGVPAVLRSTLLLLVLPLTALAADRFEFKDGDRVVLIGSTLIEREQRYGYWEAALTARNPDKNITFRNLGWSGDSVWGEARAGFGTIADGYKQLVEHVIAEKPTVIIVGYGTNESFAGPEGLPKFKKQLKKLLDDLAVTKARFVLLSPPMFEERSWKGPRYENCKKNLKLYSQAIKQEAQERRAWFVDDILEKYAPVLAATDDGMHLTDWGYRWTTVGLLEELRQGGAPGDVVKIIGQSPTRAKHDFLVDPPSPLGLGIAELSGDCGVMVSKLEPGNYTLKIDGQAVHTLTAQEEKSWIKSRGNFRVHGSLVREAERWKNGMLGAAVLVLDGPSLTQAEQLRQAIIAKNKLYFYRWRPQNVTYLFGFRKYEQGKNAIEIPKFDPLIVEKEKEIAKLRVPREHVYELVPVKEKK